MIAEIMKMICGLSVLCVSVTLISCSANRGDEDPSSDLISHASRRLHCEGLSEREVRDRFGPPVEIRTKNFAKTTYGVPPLPSHLDTQFIYYPSDLSHIYIYFGGGQAKLGVEEWSDY